MNTIILVAAHGYPDNRVADVFLQSLKNTGYRGYIGLISNDMELDYDKVIKIPWDEDTTYFRSSRRLFCYRDFLSKSPIKFDKVITSGIRDVLFYRNPEYMPVTQTDLYREPDGPTLGSCPYNSRWLRNSGYLDGIENKGIICAEILTGTHQGLLDTLNIMCDAAERNPRKYDLEDQAILNYLYWNNKLPNATLHHNEHSPVYTVGYAPFIRMKQGVIVNENLDMPYMVHQYDRHIQFSF